MSRAGELGIGISQFVSVGNKADVSGNDLLQYWEDDPQHRRDPPLPRVVREPAQVRAARRARVARTKPIVAVKSGRTAGREPRRVVAHRRARRRPTSRSTRCSARPGVIRVDTLDELLDTAHGARAPTAARRAAGSRSSATRAARASSPPTRARVPGLEVPRAVATRRRTALRAFASPGRVGAQPGRPRRRRDRRASSSARCASCSPTTRSTRCSRSSCRRS